jgi:molecular chaperone DnaK
LRWWRRFDNSDSGGEAPDEETGASAGDRRRRVSQRIGERLRIGVRCASWPELAHLFTGNISEGGVFIRSHETAPIGERIRLELALPSGATLALVGEIANVVTAAEAAHRGIAPGMGVKLDPLEGEARLVFERLLETARSHLPRPAEPLADGRPQPPRPPRPPSIAPTETVRHSLIMRAVDAAALLDEESSVSAPPPAVPPPSTAPRHRRDPRGIAIGIDLGVGHTTVTALVGSKVSVLSREGGPRHIPSIVHIGHGFKLTVGEAARDRQLTEPDRTIPGPKRLLGLPLGDPEVRRFLDSRPLASREMADGAAAVVVDDRAFTGVELCGALLGEARALAIEALGAPVEQAVVSVPLRWDEKRIDALRRAGELAGLDVVAVIDEPTAVAMANRFDGAFGGFIGVFDLGGASCDFSVLDASRADLRVLATAGDASLGCDHIDEVLARAAAEQFRRRHQVDVERAPGAWPRLLAACEAAKRGLSVQPAANIVVPAIVRRGGAALDLSLRLDGALLSRAAEPLLERALGHCERALKLAAMPAAQLSVIYLSGGGSNLPIVREALERRLGRPVRSAVQPELAIAIGAAMHAARIHGESRALP